MNYRSVFLFLSLLASCTTVPPHDLAQKTEVISLDATLQSSLLHTAFTEGAFPPANWWEMFHDPQLIDCINKALENNPTLQRAVAKVATAEQVAKETRSALFPFLGANYAESWEYFSKNGFVRSFYPTPPTVNVPSKTNQLDLSLNFSYEIDFFGKNRHEFQAAINQARAERAEADMATLLITTLTAQTYFELQTKLRQKQLLEQRLSLYNSLLNLATSNLISGLATTFEPLDREKEINALQESLLLIDKEIQLDQHMLSFLMGEGPETTPIASSSALFITEPIAVPSNLSSDLIARRPDLACQIWKVESAAEMIGVAKANFYPRVNLAALAGLESLNFANLFRIASRQGALEPAIHLPLFTGGALRANLKKHVAIFNQETFLYNEMVLNAMKEVADELITLQSLFDTMTYQTAQMEITQTELVLQQKRREAGLDPLSSVLQRQDDCIQAEWLLIQYERNYLLAVVKLIKALGGGYTDHDSRIGFGTEPKPRGSTIGSSLYCLYRQRCDRSILGSFRFGPKPILESRSVYEDPSRGKLS